MSDDPGNKADSEAARDKRRAAALRANLKRRKAQLRGRADHARPADDVTDDSFDAEKDSRCE